MPARRPMEMRTRARAHINTCLHACARAEIHEHAYTGMHTSMYVHRRRGTDTCKCTSGYGHAWRKTYTRTRGDTPAHIEEYICARRSVLHACTLAHAHKHAGGDGSWPRGADFPGSPVPGFHIPNPAWVALRALLQLSPMPTGLSASNRSVVGGPCRPAQCLVPPH